MKLVEEYLKRHEHKVPYAEFVQCGSAFYKEVEDTRWKLVNIQWRQEPMWHPGTYRITHRYVAKKGPFENGSGFRKYDEATIDWKDYEPYLREWLPTLKDLTKNRLDATVAAWELALFCFDDVLSCHAADERVFQSVDADLPSLRRAEIIEHLQVRFANSHRGFADLWRSLRSEVQNHCNWLVALRDDVK